MAGPTKLSRPNLLMRPTFGSGVRVVRVKQRRGTTAVALIRKARVAFACSGHFHFAPYQRANSRGSRRPCLPRAPVTPGLEAIRSPPAAGSILLVLSDG